MEESEEKKGREEAAAVENSSWFSPQRTSPKKTTRRAELQNRHEVDLQAEPRRFSYYAVLRIFCVPGNLSYYRTINSSC